MDELPPSARALLEAARRADDPSPLARARADASTRASLSRHGAGELPPLEPLQLAAAAPVRSGGLLKLGAGALSIATLAIGVWFGSSNGSPAPRPSPPPRAIVATPPTPIERAVPTAELPPAVTPSRPARVPSQAQRRTTSEDRGWLERELEVIGSVDSLIRRDRFDAALQLLARSEPAVVAHRLSEERRALEILARCGKSSDGAALRARDEFLNASPRSVLAARVRSACTAPRKTSN